MLVHDPVHLRFQRLPAPTACHVTSCDIALLQDLAKRLVGRGTETAEQVSACSGAVEEHGKQDVHQMPTIGYLM